MAKSISLSGMMATGLFPSQLYKSVLFLTKLRLPGRLRFYFDTTINRTHITSENVDEYCSF